MLSIKTIIALLLCLLSIIPSFSQTRQYRFERFSYAQGLPYGQVYDITVDTFGFVWFATVGGLFKYDGYRFHPYYYDSNDTTTLSNPNVFAILQDSKGRIWAGTANGLNLYDRATNSFKHFFAKKNVQDTLASNNIGKLFEDSSGRIWVGTATGLQLFNPADSTFITFKEIGKWAGKFSPTNIHEVMEDKNHQLWAAASDGNGILKVNIAQKTVERILPKSYQDNGKSQLAIIRLHTDVSGTIWAGSTEGLYQWIPDKNEFIQYPLPDSLKKIQITRFISKGNDLWIGTSRHGLLRLNICTNEWTHFTHAPSNPRTLIDADTRSFAFDHSGNLWIGALSGVNKFNFQHINFPFYQVSPGGISNENFVWYVFENQRNNLLMRIMGAPEIWISNKLGDKPEVFNVLGDPSFGYLINPRFEQGDSLWIFHPGKGIMAYSLKEKTYHLIYSGALLKSTKAVNGCPDVAETPLLWLYSDKGLCKVNKETGQQEWFFPKDDIPWLESNYLHLPLQISKDTFIFQFDPTGARTLGCFDKKTNKFIDLKTAFRLKEAIPNGRVRQMSKAPNGDVWIASIHGLIQFSPSQRKFKIFTTKTGLIENDIMAVISDARGYVWFSSEHYISRYNPKDSSFWHFDMGKEIRGFMSGSAIQSKSGKLIFSGSDGIIAFHPDSVKLHPMPPRVVLTDFKIRSQSVDLSTAPELVKSIKVNYRDNILQFEFAGLHFVDPQNNKYQYKLQGFNEDWIELGTERQVTFTNLFPRTYYLQVKAANSDGVWGGEKEMLRIRLLVRPPWYLTWWFFALLGLTIAAIIYYLYRFQLNRRLALERAELAEEKEQLAQERNQQLRELDTAKTRLYTNITHEFRTPLTIILGMADKIEQSPRQWLQEGTQMIKRNGQNLLRLVNQMLDLSRLEAGSLPVNRVQGDLVAYLRTLLELFRSYAESKNIELKFESETAQVVMDYDADKMKDIISNLLSNALKFTPAGGTIKLEVRGTNDESRDVPLTSYLELRVRDTGAGIPAEKLSHIFDRFYQTDDSATRRGEGTGIGLALTKELVKLLGGTIEVESEVGKDSTFTVQLPIRNTAPMLETLPFLPPPSPEKNTIPKVIPPKATRELPLALVVEDNADVMQYLALCLQSKYRLEFAYNGQEGIEKAIEIVPDVIISDVMMPEKDGFELCQTLKTDVRTSHIPIILLTALGDTPSRLEGLELGADAYLKKPFNERELEISLRKSLELRQRLRERYAKDPFVPPPPNKNFAQDDAFVKAFHELVVQEYHNDEFSIKIMAKTLGLSHSQLGRKVNALLGVSPHQYLHQYRLQRGRYLVENTDRSLTDIAYSTGFGSLQRFSNAFLEAFQQRPSDLR